MMMGLLVLFGCQLAGEFAVRLLDVPVPGAVVGMALLLVWLCVGRTEDSGVAEVCERLLSHMQVLFIPAGVGVTQYLAVLGTALAPVVLGLVVSWLAALAVTAAAVLALQRLRAA